MKKYRPDTKFAIVAHSTGSDVAYLAMLQEQFPADKMVSIFNLAGPLNQAP